MDQKAPVQPAPSVFRLAGHPLRWQLLTELARSDRQVRELTERLGEPQSLVSYHLARLRAGQLVTMRRSSADRRDAYYTLDLENCRQMLTEAGCALHPGLASGPPNDIDWARRHRVRVLFVCTGNSTRSQMAEAFLREHSGHAVDVVSAGSEPKPVHPNAVRVMREKGIDLGGCESKHLDRFTRRRFDCVVTLCDRVREVCPDFRGDPETIHWSVADPSLEGETDEESYPAFLRTAAEIETRVRYLTHVIAQATPRR